MVTVLLPGGAEIWISDAGARVDHPAHQHTGWTAYLHTGPDDEIGQQIYEQPSTGIGLAADTVSLLAFLIRYVDTYRPA
ncbi:hypothetical protein GCM10010358_68250 [Streptomyces minutiscleroticus]|uniref:Uncharacterized protein n=1 Tax=Streptomyces minutiscleroticus TaxID=68238 RepID=A0A918NY79_9ACTN|nr:hypothetical protein [Streptomyces minutiscleroticus]GGY05204.1 hypothetical protein GCM10010358_68250 [Streptomyces minutiscleroticus]